MSCPICNFKLVRLSSPDIFRCKVCSLYFRIRRGVPSPSTGMVVPIISPSPRGLKGSFDVFLQDLGISKSDYNSMPPSVKRQLSERFISSLKTDSFREFLKECGIDPAQYEMFSEETKSDLRKSYHLWIRDPESWRRMAVK